MADKQRAGKKNYVEERDVTIELLDQDTGLTLYDGSTPPRVQKIDVLSCFLGVLRVGDELLSVDKRPMASVKDFKEATQLGAGNEPKNVLLRFRRDNYYQMVALKKAAIKKKPNRHAIYLQARWRPDLPIGIIVENKAGAVVISSVEPGSVAAQYFQTGDVLVEVNEKGVKDITAAKRSIRSSIVATKTVKLKIERDVAPLKRIVEPAADVLKILAENMGFWARPCKLRPIDESQPTAITAQSRQRVYHIPDIDTEVLAVDESGKALTATPDRDGGTRDEADAGGDEQDNTEEEEV